MPEPMDTMVSTSTQNETSSASPTANMAESRPKKNLRQTSLLDYRAQQNASSSNPVTSQSSQDSEVTVLNTTAATTDGSQGATAGEISDVDSDSQPPHKKRKLRSAAGNEDTGIEGQEATDDSLKVILSLPPSVLSCFAAHAIRNSSQVQSGIQNTVKHVKKVRTSSASTKSAQNARAAPPKKAPKKPQVSPIDSRPMPWGMPQVWAENRADLCKTLPYFNAYQGSSYTNHGTVKGKLLDQDHGERKYMDEEIVITRAGGGIGDDGSKNKIQIKDQNGDGSEIKSFRNNMERGIPLMLVVGSNNMYCPSKVPYRYCVLGAFHVTDIWAEKTDRHIVWKFRLEKLDLDYKSWWAAEDSGSLPKSKSSVQMKAKRKECGTCRESSKQVYQQGWMCLNAKCKLHWILNGTSPPKDLDFHDDFRMERTTFNGFQPPYSMIPKLPCGTGLQAMAKQCEKGIVCPKCGRCNQRIDWHGWICQSQGCDFQLVPPFEIIPACAVMGDLSLELQGHAISEDQFESKQVQCKPSVHGLHVMHNYHLHDGIVITHGHSNAIINSQPGGANDIFEALQNAKLGLRRLLVQSPTGGTRSAHFSKNYGLPYKYHVNQPDSTSFVDAPAEICQAIRRMTWVAQRVIGEGSRTVFNECLTVGYFEQGHMGYHDDGEDTLGPDIAAWSLGAPAEMKFRMKFKYFSGLSKDRSRYDPDLPIVSGCYQPETRRKLNDMKGQMSKEALSAKARQLLRGCPSHAPVIISMQLRHGDFMSMHGSLMQQYYEHQLTSVSQLRFAMTCRYVKLDMISPELHSKGDLPMDPAEAYDGDLKAFDDWKQQDDALKVAASLRRRGATSTAPVA